MKLELTFGGMEAFEDAVGVGVFTMLQSVGDMWTIKRVRALVRASVPPETTDADIEAWLRADYLGAVTAAMDALAVAVTPPEEAAEHLPTPKEGGASGGNSPPAAG